MGKKKTKSGAVTGARAELELSFNPDQDDNLPKPEPMEEKPVGSLAGIGEVLGKKLEEGGFDKAYMVLGQFLVLKKDEDLFQEWLKDTCGTNAKQFQGCFRFLREWCHAFL